MWWRCGQQGEADLKDHVNDGLLDLFLLKWIGLHLVGNFKSVYFSEVRSGTRNSLLQFTSQKNMIHGQNTSRQTYEKGLTAQISASPVSPERIPFYSFNL